ncbi:Multidrug resistance efflux pump [Pseudarcicella hirudinis]|uniref:Multidrug resistance efflux pump n=1 Tax=Pseudarcicella hirudinis TaxID=1079859 RepID=A0A1I5QHT3_9BACT|nr:HlyD family efflux transporter periplasmic adaptor subunit [Pseudarcicella hirudinis]SFP45793.1 Multidrug resistance efflux pump [Pseudarcicella hirudinis]
MPVTTHLNGSSKQYTAQPAPLAEEEVLSEIKPLLELRSEEVHEILSKTPAPIIRWGLTIIAIIGIFGIGISWTIKYPDIIQGNATITTQQPPLNVIPRASGRLQALLINPNQVVKKGAFLAEIENTTALENSSILKALSLRLKHFLEKPDTEVTFPSNTLTFGDLQTEYNVILKNYQEYRRLMNDAIYLQRKKILISQVEDYHKLVKINERQVAINAEEFKNAETKYNSDKKLFNEKVYGKLEFLSLENTFLQKKKDNENYNKTLIENSLTLSEKQRQLAELDFDFLQKTRAFKDNIQQSVQNIDNLLTAWKQNYLLTAPSDGKVNFLKNLAINQVVRTGDTLFAILPENQPIIAMANVPAQNFGKVHVGQQVIIKLINYPYQEYGSINGNIQEIASSASGKNYRIFIQLPHGLKTAYGKTLPFNTEMQGSAEIITEDLRLLERAFYGFRKLINQR